MAAGEAFLLDVYSTLRQSKLWAETLLIVTYDEHGGCYDHVPPPENAVPPDSSVGDYGFDFKRFGPRVPTVLISPLSQAGTVYRSASATPFDHTSILATIEKRFSVPALTKRDAAAPDVWSVLTLQTARTDDPLASVKAPQSSHKAPTAAEPDHLQSTLAELSATLPGSDNRGHQPNPPSFATGKDAISYVHQRYSEFARARHSQRRSGK